MTILIRELASLALWHIWLARWYARQTWDSLPGPWPVRILLVAGCLIIPGPCDELALAALVTILRRRKNRRTRSCQP